MVMNHDNTSGGARYLTKRPTVTGVIWSGHRILQLAKGTVGRQISLKRHQPVFWMDLIMYPSFQEMQVEDPFLAQLHEYVCT